MDAAFWQKQWDAFVSAPVASLIFLAVGAVAAWWFRGMILRERATVLEERLRLASETVQRRDEDIRKLGDDLQELRPQEGQKQGSDDFKVKWDDALSRLMFLYRSNEEIEAALMGITSRELIDRKAWERRRK